MVRTKVVPHPVVDTAVVAFATTGLLAYMAVWVLVYPASWR